MRTLLRLAVAGPLLALAGCQVAPETPIRVGDLDSAPYMTLDEFGAALDDEGEVMLVEFCVPSGCSRCEAMRASIDRLASDRREGVTVRRVDLSQHLQLAWEFELTACPSYVAFRNGDEVFRASYPTSTEDIALGLEAALRQSSADQVSVAVQ